MLRISEESGEKEPVMSVDSVMFTSTDWPVVGRSLKAASSAVRCGGRVVMFVRPFSQKVNPQFDSLTRFVTILTEP